MINNRPSVSSLENPLYYLENFRTVLAWVARYHADLLTRQEAGQLEKFGGLSTAAQALLTRLVMRTGSQFRLARLNYPELGRRESLVVQELAGAGWLDTGPAIDLDGLFRLFTRAELVEMLDSWRE